MDGNVRFGSLADPLTNLSLMSAYEGKAEVAFVKTCERLMRSRSVSVSPAGAPASLLHPSTGVA